jgi:hypothetical protein
VTVQDRGALAPATDAPHCVVAIEAKTAKTLAASDAPLRRRLGL